MVLEGRSGNSADGRQRFKFTGKERDTESKYDYFGARYYDARIGRWFTPDPLAAIVPQNSPFDYALNNPVRLIDATGKIPGEYKDEQGQTIGDDGKKDGKVYITDQSTIENNSKEGKTNWDGVQNDPNTVLLPAADTRTAIAGEVAKAGPINEVGGIVGVDSKGGEHFLPAIPGDPYNGSKSNNAEINVWAPRDMASWKKVLQVKSEVHTHPLGDANAQFVQPPSKIDNGNASRVSGHSYVVGMKSGVTYIYNASRIIRTIPNSVFLTPK
jgi:RHS repeat-associated protein